GRALGRADAAGRDRTGAGREPDRGPRRRAHGEPGLGDGARGARLVPRALQRARDDARDDDPRRRGGRVGRPRDRAARRRGRRRPQGGAAGRRVIGRTWRLPLGLLLGVNSALGPNAVFFAVTLVSIAASVALATSLELASRAVQNLATETAQALAGDAQLE